MGGGCPPPGQNATCRRAPGGGSPQTRAARARYAFRRPPTRPILAEDRPVMPMHRTRRLAVLGAIPLALAALFSPVARASGWVANGVPLTLAANNQTAPLAVADALGGAYFVWLDKRTGSAERYAQHRNGA